MTPRYTPRALALALLALAPAALRAQTAETWRFTRTITFRTGVPEANVADPPEGTENRDTLKIRFRFPGPISP